MGVFCHDDDEYERLMKIRDEITEPSDNPDQKYYRLIQPIIIPVKDDIPETTYTELYIRKPDTTSYGNYIGDVDFYLEPQEYLKVKNSLLEGVEIKGARIYDRPGWDMIQLFDPNISSVGYVSTKDMTEKVRIKQK